MALNIISCCLNEAFKCYLDNSRKYNPANNGNTINREILCPRNLITIQKYLIVSQMLWQPPIQLAHVPMNFFTCMSVQFKCMCFIWLHQLKTTFHHSMYFFNLSCRRNEVLRKSIGNSGPNFYEMTYQVIFIRMATGMLLT